MRETRAGARTLTLLAAPAIATVVRAPARPALLRVPVELSGSCRMGVKVNSGGERGLVGALTQLDGGRVVSCTVQLNGHPDAWATGTLSGWLQAATATPGF